MSRVLVTGGAGFIGSHLVEALIMDGHEVIVLDDLSTGRQENVTAKAILEIGDVNNQPLVQALMRQVDYCYHLAARPAVRMDLGTWQQANLINSGGMVSILDAARHARVDEPVPVIYASSAAVYGEPLALPLHEDTQCRPISAYGVDKHSCEAHARIGWSLFNIASVGLRFFNAYGPRQVAGSPYSGVITIFADHLFQKKPILIRGDGRQTRDFIYVSDIVGALIAAMPVVRTGAQVFNVCTGVPTSIQALAETMSGLVGEPADLLYRPAYPGDIRHSVGDNNRLTEALGFRPQVSLQDGLRKTLAAPLLSSAA